MQIIDTLSIEPGNMISFFTSDFELAGTVIELNDDGKFEVETGKGTFFVDPADVTDVC